MARRSKLVRNTLGFLLPTLLIIAGIWWFFAALGPVDRNRTEKSNVTISKGTGVRAIAQQLEEKGLIRSSIAFQLAVGLGGMAKSLQAGTYELSPSMSATEIARMFVQAKTQREMTLTIPEGWTSKQIGQYFEKQGIGTAEEFTTNASVYDSRTILPDDTFTFLADRPKNATLEGYLFPDTYRVYPDATQKDVIGKMLTNFGTKVTPELREALARSGRKLSDAIILASIVQNEVRCPNETTACSDRRIVADIFWRRIAAGIPLQSDATVNYVTGKGKSQPSSADLEVNSPYNTYLNRGLPPGPIGNPGLSSIVAAIRPEANQYFFFLTDASGGVHYAKTYEEHLANKKQYLP